MLRQVPWELTQVNATTIHDTLLGAGTVSGAVNSGWARSRLLGAQDQHWLLLHKFVLFRAQAVGAISAKHRGPHSEHQS